MELHSIIFIEVKEEHSGFIVILMETYIDAPDVGSITKIVPA